MAQTTPMDDLNRADVAEGVTSEENEASWSRLVESGMEAGILAGVLTMIVVMLHSAFMSEGFWTPLNLIGATWLGREALAGGAIVGIMGAITHVGVSAFWGGFFGLIGSYGARSVWASLIEGLVVGVVVWTTMTFMVLPWADPILRERVSDLNVTWFGYHLLFGALFSLTPLFANTPIERSGSGDESDTHVPLI